MASRGVAQADTGIYSAVADSLVIHTGNVSVCVYVYLCMGVPMG